MIVASESSPELAPHEGFLPWWKSVVSAYVQTRHIKGQHLDLSEGSAVPVVAEAITSSIRQVEMEIRGSQNV